MTSVSAGAGAFRPLPIPLCGALSVALLLRLWLIWQHGPLIWPDSGGYSGAAEQILAASSWQEFGRSFTTFRAIGYPAFLAAAMLAAGESWPYVVVGMQTALSLLTLVWLYRLGVAAGMGAGWSAFAGGFFIFSHIAIYDVSLLTDSLFAHLFLIAVSAFLVPWLETGGVTLRRAIGCGAMLAAATLVREATIFLIPVFGGGLFFVIRKSGLRWRSTVAIVMLFTLPAILAWQTYIAWNEVRTGHRFVTTVGQSVYLLHPLELEQQGIQVFAVPMLREAFAATESNYTYGRALRINEYLSVNYKLDDYARLMLAQDAFWTAWKIRPLGMAKQALHELRLRDALRLVSVTMSIREAEKLTGGDVKTGFTEIGRAISIGGISLTLTVSIIAEGLSRLLSAIVFLACVVGIPYAFVLRYRRGDHIPARLWALALFWLLYAAMTGMYAVIHSEFRYTIPVQGLAVIAGLAMIEHVWRRFLRPS